MVGLAEKAVRAPDPRRAPRSIEIHDRVRSDEFGWMRTADWPAVVRDPSQLSLDIRAHLEQENAYASRLLGPAEAIEHDLFRAMLRRVPPAQPSAPRKRGDWTYRERLSASAEHPMHVRTREGVEQVLLDEAERAKGHGFYAAVGAKPSGDNRYFAWAEDCQGNERYTIHVSRIGDGISRPPIENASGRFIFSPCSRWIFWTARNETGHPNEVRMAAVDGEEERSVFVETDAALFVSVTATASKAFIVVNLFNDACSESWIIDANDPTLPPRCVEPRRDGLFYEVQDWHGQLILRTNLDTPEFRLMAVDAADPGAVNWVPFHGDGISGTIEDMQPYRDALLILERSGGRHHLKLMQRDDPSTVVELDVADGAVVSLESDVAFGSASVEYRCWSHTMPQTLLAHELDTGRVLQLWQRQAPNFDADLYQTQLIEVASADGEIVPLSLFRRRDTPLDGSAKVLLYGYGAYCHAADPWFDPAEIALVDRGWIYAIAHVRGGGEKGRQWHESGRGLLKRNSFDDFIACAQYLVDHGYGREGRIVAHGISAGGLLVGAALDLAATLFGGVIAEVPFVDVLNSQCDYSLPLTMPERAEWGDPQHSVEDFDLIAAYAPYETVTSKPYPPVLATASLCDSRVPYWEAAKWIARLRQAAPRNGPYLLETRMESGGHGGVSGRFAELRKAAHLYAFAEWALT